MRVASKILGPDGKPLWRDARPRGMSAKYDAASNNLDNRRHWQAADALSANAANSLEVRSKLRERARYEFNNNSYCLGIIETLANDLIGVGPTLQSLTDDDALNREVELAWLEWSEAVGLAEKLHTLKQAKTRDGEAFALFINNPLLDNPVQLDVLDIECDYVTAPYPAQFEAPRPNYIDGIHLDSARNPLRYDVLKEHPGDGLFPGSNQDFTSWKRENVLHWFRVDRPGQARGVPEITPAIPLFAQVRRFILATLSAAEIAASFAAMLESTGDIAGDPESQVAGEAFETLEIVRGMMTVLPGNHKMSQLEARHPGPAFSEFKREMLKEIGRCVNAPYDVTAADTGPYNYSSAKLSRGLYQISLRVERNSCRRNLLERIFSRWFPEAQAERLIRDDLELPTLLRAWNWPGTTAIEPLKEAKATTESLNNGTWTLAEEAAENGKDWQDRMRQQAREKKLKMELGLDEPKPAQPAQSNEDIAAMKARLDELEERLWSMEGSSNGRYR
jgi:lambda family phage portal protein